MFYSRLRELGSHAKLEQLEEDLKKRSVYFEHAGFQYTNGTTFGSQNTATGAQLCHQWREREGKRINKKFAEHTQTGAQLHTCAQQITEHFNNTKTTKSTPMQKMWQSIQSSTSPDLPSKKPTLQYLQENMSLYVVMHSKEARTKNPSKNNLKHQANIRHPKQDG